VKEWSNDCDPGNERHPGRRGDVWMPVTTALDVANLFNEQHGANHNCTDDDPIGWAGREDSAVAGSAGPELTANHAR
jgi:hypothetical protein